jgi:hypothetical protein
MKASAPAQRLIALFLQHRINEESNQSVLPELGNLDLRNGHLSVGRQDNGK